MTQPASEYRGTVLWSALQAIVTELAATGEVAINTGPDYVIAYLCHELVARKVVTEAALQPRRGSERS